MTDEQPNRNPAVISILAMIIMLVLYTLTAMGYMGPNPVGQGDTYVDPLIVPAGYAFSIWSIIYIALIVWPIYRYIKVPEYHIMWLSVHRWYAANVVANGMWLVAASFDWQIISVGIILFMLFTLVKIYYALNILEQLGRTRYWVDRFGFSVYFAWITLATALNFSSALSFYEWNGWGISELSWALIILPVAIFITMKVSWKFKDLAYAAVPIWALIALVVKQWEAYPTLGYFAAGLLISLVLLWGYIWYSTRISTPSARG